MGSGSSVRSRTTYPDFSGWHESTPVGNNSQSKEWQATPGFNSANQTNPPQPSCPGLQTYDQHHTHQATLYGNPYDAPYPASQHQDGMPTPFSQHNSEIYPLQQPEPVGKRDSDLSSDEGSIDMNETSENRDRIFMLVLSAEEFLARMSETDERIRKFSIAHEREMHKKTIQDSLGLRGHIQDELLRIERMLAEDDPDLKCLKPYKKTFPNIVLALRELNKKNKLIEQQKAVVELPVASLTVAPDKKTMVLHKDSTAQAAGSSHAVQTSFKASHDSVGAQTFSATDAFQNQGVATELNTEEDLEQHHRKEEKIVAEQFAKKLVQRSAVNDGDVNKVMGDHALAMQALRKRQEAERKKWQELMEAKKREKLRNKGKSQVYDSLHDSRQRERTIHETIVSQRKDDLLRPSGAEAEPQHSTDASANRDIHDDNPDEEIYEEDFEEDDEEDVDEEVTKNTANAMWSKVRMGFKPNDLKTMMKTIKEDESMKTKLRRKESALYDPDSSSQPPVDKQQVLQEIEASDRSFIQKQLNKKRISGMSDEEFARLMKSHLAGEEQLRQYRDAQRKLHRDRLKEKLARRRQGIPRDEDSDTEEEDHQQADDVIQEKLDKLERKFEKELRKTEELSENDLADLLASYRKKQMRIVQQQGRERSKHNDKLQAKLEAKKLQKRKDAQNHKSYLEDGEADGDFWEKLQAAQQRGELTKEEFSQLLAGYMQREKQRQRASRQRIGVTLSKEEASKLLEQHQQNQEKAQELRRAEKDKMDERLKKRLAEKQQQKKN